MKGLFMAELDQKLSTAEAAAKLANEELEKLNTEYEQVTEALNRASRDFDAMVSAKKRQRQLAESIFDATVAARKANIEALKARREIALEAKQEAIRHRQEQESSLDAEIAELEKKLVNLKIQRSSLLDAVTSADREQAKLNEYIHDSEMALSEYIRKSDLGSPQMEKPSVVKAAAVPLGGNLTHLGPA
jgi:chromosome segregation ATPase